MVSIYQILLGNDYAKLHPKLQERYEMTEGHGFTGRGVMETIAGGSFLIRPFFRLGLKRRLLFPERGQQIPFKIHNKVTKSDTGETRVVWERTFQYSRGSRHFDAVMGLDEANMEMYDWFGVPPVLLSSLSFQVGTDGSLQITSKKQWLCLFGNYFPLPKWLYGMAAITEAYDDDRQCYRVDVHVKNTLFGTLFSYRGTFQEMGENDQ